MKKIVCSILIIALVVSVLGSSVGAESPIAVRISVNPVPLSTPTIVMRADGLLDEELAKDGAKAVFVSGLTSGALMSEAMQAGSLDIASVTGATSAITSFSGGRNIRIVAGYSTAPEGFAIVVSPASDIQSVKDLKGRTVVGPVGSEVHYLLARALEEAGLTLGDVKLLNDSVANAVQYVVSGSADAALLVDPVLTVYESQNKVRVLRNGSGLISGKTFIGVRAGFLRDHPELVRDYLVAQSKAMDEAKAMGDEAVKLAASDLKMPVPVIEKVSAKYVFSMAIDDSTRQELQSIADFLFDAGLLRVRPDLTSLIDTSLLGALQQ